MAISKPRRGGAGAGARGVTKPRTERDGDVVMAGAGPTRGQRGGGITKGRGRGQLHSRNPASTGTARDSTSSGPRRTVNLNAVRNELSRQGLPVAGTFSVRGRASNRHTPRHLSRPQESRSRQDEPEEAEGTKQAKQILKDFLMSRYNVETKLLDLKALGQDPQLVAIGMFQSTSTQSKFFPALMKIADQQFENPQQKRDAIHSVSLASNELESITIVTTLAQTFPDIKNLDLSNNKLADLTALGGWRHKFRNLDYLMLSGNPLTTQAPDYKSDMKRWYPRLRWLDNEQIRTDEEAANAHRTKKNPLPTRGPSFSDEAGIAETFVRNFFAGYDTNRPALVNMYYDQESAFSMAINTHAKRDPKSEHEKPNWAPYIRLSRNIKHLTNPQARKARKLHGPSEISNIFSQLPASQHPDLALEPQKWIIDCQAQPGVPDPTGQAQMGVGGFLVTIRGEFTEKETGSLRSFDRVFILGPGGPAGVRIVSEMLTVRAYGGYQAWQADVSGPVLEAAVEGGNPGIIQAAGMEQAAQVSVQGDVAVGQAVGGSVPEQEALVAEVMRLTNMKPEFARLCLVEQSWNLQQALAAFETARGNLGPEAFLS